MTIDSDQSKAITIRVACRAGALILASEGFTAADAWGEKEIRSKGLGAEATVRRNENGRGGGGGEPFPRSLSIVHSDSKSDNASRINNRDLVTLTRSNKMPAVS